MECNEQPTATLRQSAEGRCDSYDYCGGCEVCCHLSTVLVSLPFHLVADRTCAVRQGVINLSRWWPTCHLH